VPDNPIPIPTPSLGATSLGYPGGTYPPSRRMGQFDKLQTGSFQVAAEDQLVSKRYFGLRHTDTFFDALVTSSAGQFYLISNAVQSGADGSLAAAPWLGAFQATPDGMVPDPRYVAWTGRAVQTLSAEGRVTYSLPDVANPEEFSFSDTDLEWKSANGDVQLSGALAGNGTQWRLPWREPDGTTGEIFYNQQGYRVEGTYYGEPVAGHIVLETMWGNENYGDTWWVRNRVGHWAFLVNNYADGSSEYGQFLCGEYGARGAVLVNEKGEEVLNTTNINAVENDDGRVVYDFGNGDQWEFISDPTRGFPAFGTTRLRVGSARRVNEERTIVDGNGTYLTAERMGETESFR
jgi:hypothetical protein